MKNQKYITSPEAYSMTITAVRIFSLMFVIRGLVLIAQYGNIWMIKK